MKFYADFEHVYIYIYFLVQKIPLQRKKPKDSYRILFDASLKRVTLKQVKISGKLQQFM